MSITNTFDFSTVKDENVNNENQMKYISFLLLISILSCSPQKERVEITKSDHINLTRTTELPSVKRCGYEADSSDYNNWTLVFEDNFDTDLSNWDAWESGAFNEELQYYQLENISLKEGLLYIIAKREKVSGATDPFNDEQKDFEFTSGRIESKKYFGPDTTEGNQEVRFSARLRLVEGEGLWPAWWSYNDPWPTKGEIDILEARGNKPYEFQSCFHYGAQVNTLETDAKFNEGHYKFEEKLTECFHVYDLVWSQNQFQIIFDGEIVKTYDVDTFEHVDEFFNMKHKLVLNLAVGGWFFDNYDVDKIADQSHLVVDYVRVYQR